MAEENKKQNPNNVFSGSMSAFAEEVDQDILAQAEANPNEKFGSAYKESSVKAVTMHTNVRLTADGNWETELR